MPGALYHAGARGLCPHAGTVSTVSTNKRVFVGGQAVATAGGGARNQQWAALRSNLLGVDVVRAANSDAAFGAAVLALRG